MIAVLTQPDGNVTVTDGLDADHLIPSFPSLQKLVTALVDELTGEVAGVRDIATQITALVTSADQSASASAASAEESADSAAQAETARTASETSATASAASAASSEVSNLASAHQAQLSNVSAGSSAASATAAANSATTAAHEADDSAASASTALIALGDAQSARNLSQAWAANLEDQPVIPGEFSALHWAKKAQAFATGSLVYLGTWDASSNTLPSGAKKGAFYKIGGTGIVNGVTYRVGDQIVHNGTDFDLIDNTETVTAVAGKVGNVTLGIDDITSLATALSGKANINHQHAIADVVGLQTVLDSKQASLGYTPMDSGNALAYSAITITQAAMTPSLSFVSSTRNKGYRLNASIDNTNDYGLFIDRFNGSAWITTVTIGNSAVSIAGNVTANAYATSSIGSTIGTASMVPGTSANTGYIEFRQKDGTTRSGYIGFAGTDKRLNYVAENGWSHFFTGTTGFNNAVTYYAGVSYVARQAFVNTTNSVMRYYTEWSDSQWGLHTCDDGGGYSGTGLWVNRGTRDLTVGGWVYAPNFKITSDLRLKDNQEFLNGREELDKIKLLLPMQYDKQGHHEYGFGAQHVKTVYPTMVTVGEGSAGIDTHTLSVGELLAPLVAAVQELDRRLTKAGI